MGRSLRWYAGLHKFYRILLLAGMGIGGLLIGAGMATSNGIMFLLGAFWLVASPALVHVTSRFDDD